MRADESCRAEIVALVHDTYTRLSTPGSNFDELFAHSDMTLAGSDLGELFYRPEDVQELAKGASSRGLTWTCETVTVWQEGDVAWAQILGFITAALEVGGNQVAYWNTGIFARDEDGWHWRYWGGSEPKESPGA